MPFPDYLDGVILTGFLVNRSMFSLTPGIPFYKDLWRNQVLLWAVVGGMISVVIRKFFLSSSLICIVMSCLHSRLRAWFKQPRVLSNRHFMGMEYCGWHDRCVYCLVRGVETHEEEII